MGPCTVRKADNQIRKKHEWTPKKEKHATTHCFFPPL